MIDLSGTLTAPERLVLAVDTSDLSRARQLAGVAHDAGARIIKQGLELASAPGSSWEFCSENAAEADLDWVADAKIDDIPNTTAGIVRNLVSLEHPPIAITIHTTSGVDSMEAAQQVAGEAGVLLFGVTELTSNKEAQLRKRYAFILEQLGLELKIDAAEDDPVLRGILVHALAREAAEAEVGGLVASAKELRKPIKIDPVTAGKVTMIPGTRSLGAATNDQQNVETPELTIVDGADLLVIGRQVTAADNPPEAFEQVVEEVQSGMDRRAA